MDEDVLGAKALTALLSPADTALENEEGDDAEEEKEEEVVVVVEEEENADTGAPANAEANADSGGVGALESAAAVVPLCDEKEGLKAEENEGVVLKENVETGGALSLEAGAPAAANANAETGGALSLDAETEKADTGA